MTKAATEALEAMKSYLKDRLRIKLENGDFTDPNNRRIVLLLEDREIDAVSFSVRQTREYEG
jgi:hypothetical protein